MLVDWDLAHGENGSPKYSFITPTNEHLIHKNMFLHCSNMFRRHWRHLQKFLHRNL